MNLLSKWQIWRQHGFIEARWSHSRQSSVLLWRSWMNPQVAQERLVRERCGVCSGIISDRFCAFWLKPMEWESSWVREGLVP